jgi:hypothetical protein
MEKWKVFDNAGKYVMVVALYYDITDNGVQECATCCERIRQELKVEILAGTPKSVFFEMANTNMWFGVATAPMKMIFSEGSGINLSAQALDVDGVYWRIENKTEQNPLRVSVQGVTQDINTGQYFVEPFTIENGWHLGGSEQIETLTFVVKARMKGQSREIELVSKNRVTIKGGVPKTIQILNESDLLKLEPNKPLVCQLVVLDAWRNHVRGSSTGSNRRMIKITTKSKCLDRNKQREKEFIGAPMQMDLGTVTASFGDGGKLHVHCAMTNCYGAGIRAVDLALDLYVLRLQLCFVYLCKGQSEASPDATGTNLEYRSADMPAQILLKAIDPKTGEVEAIDKQLKLALKRSTTTEFTNVKLIGGKSTNLVQQICPSIHNSSGTYVATSDDGMLEATLQVKVLPAAPSSLLIRNADKLSLRIGERFKLGFDVVDSRGVVYTEATDLRILLQCSDGSIEFDPAPDDEDGTFEILKSSLDSQMGLFYLQTALVGRVPPSKKVTITAILKLQGGKPIKRAIVAQIEAGEATQLKFADATTNTILGADATFVYTSGQELGLRLMAVDDSGNMVSAFTGQKAVVTLKTSSGGTGSVHGEEIQKEINVNMVSGEGDLSTERWYVPVQTDPQAEGQVSAKISRNAGLMGVTLNFPIKPGKWLSDVVLSVGSQQIDALTFEMPADEKV